MKVAAIQMRSTEDIASNIDAAAVRLRRAGAEGVDLAVLPEVFTYLGRGAGRADAAEMVPGGPSTAMMSSVAREAGMWVTGGVIEREGEHIFNTTPLFDRSGELVATYRKIHLYDVELPGQPPFRESATFTAGEQVVTHDVEGTRVGLSTCYDIRFPELYRALMVAGAQVFTIPSQFQFQTGVDHWEVLLRARAIENQCFVVAADQWGTYGDPAKGRRSYGNSMIVDPWGRIVDRSAEEGDDVLIAELDMAELRRIRETMPVLQHRRLGITC